MYVVMTEVLYCSVVRNLSSVYRELAMANRNSELATYESVWEQLHSKLMFCGSFRDHPVCSVTVHPLRLSKLFYECFWTTRCTASYGLGHLIWTTLSYIASWWLAALLCTTLHNSTSNLKFEVVLYTLIIWRAS